MARYHSDTESDSYRYDDSNSSADSITDLDIPQYNQKNALQIAEYLDSKLNDGPIKKSIAINTSTNYKNTNSQQSKSKSFQSPSSEKVWTPLSQSTPADIPSSKDQPKDILKAKSKLSKLAGSAGADDTTEEEAEEESDDSNEKLSQDTSFQDTPSKASKRKPTSIVTNKKQANISQPVQLQPKSEESNDKVLNELEELRKLKKYILCLPNGSSLIELSSSNSKIEQGKFQIFDIDEVKSKQDSIEFLTSEVSSLKNQNTNKQTEIDALQSKVSNLDKQDKLCHETIESLKSQVSITKSQNEGLKEEVTIVKNSNYDFKESLELKNNVISDFKKKNEESEAKLREILETNAKLEQELKEVQSRLENLIGNTKDSITPEKHVSLQAKSSENSKKSVYEALELDTVNELDLTKAHNMIKNVLINLGIPFSKTKETIPQISKLLQSEDILCDFANKIHLLLYKEELNISRFKKESHGEEGLYQCTSQMLKNVELLASMKRNHH